VCTTAVIAVNCAEWRDMHRGLFSSFLPFVHPTNLAAKVGVCQTYLPQIKVLKPISICLQTLLGSLLLQQKQAAAALPVLSECIDIISKLGPYPVNPVTPYAC
jgi:hypothetical protein